MAPLDEDTVDEILYLARVNEATELGSLFSELSAQTKLSNAELSALSVDPETKNSALHYAAANGHLDVIKLLFSYSTDKPAPQLINAVNDAGNTPLHWAALNGRLECVQLLIESGADVTIINQAGHDAVFEAEINDKKDVVDWLLGAVEELEKGIGDAGDAPEDMAADVDGSNTQGSTKETGAVEDVRKQMEEMKTDNAVSKDG